MLFVCTCCQETVTCSTLNGKKEVLQAELGDHDPDEHRTDYISDFHFAPSQTREMEEKVVELHKSHRSAAAPGAHRDWFSG